MVLPFSLFVIIVSRRAQRPPGLHTHPDLALPDDVLVTPEHCIGHHHISTQRSDLDTLRGPGEPMARSLAPELPDLVVAEQLLTRTETYGARIIPEQLVEDGYLVGDQRRLVAVEGLLDLCPGPIQVRDDQRSLPRIDTGSAGAGSADAGSAATAMSVVRDASMPST